MDQLPDFSQGTILHTAFDALAWIFSLLSGWLIYRWRLQDSTITVAEKAGSGYAIWLGFGAVAGAYFLGTANLFLSGHAEIGRSILGGLAGGIAGVELYKKRKNIKGSTGFLFAVPFAVTVMIGRWGCFLAGLDDYTYGTATDLPWGIDFGDGIKRHPVQLYESASMALFVTGALAALTWKPDVFIRHGFYICVGWYAAQRFIWEFLKPYGELFGTLNIFQYVCLILIGYSLIMTRKGLHDRRRP